MLEVGWSEILVIAIILIVVVGPKDLPAMMRTFGKMMGRVRSMANEFRSQFDEAMREAELDDVRKGLGEVNKYNPASALRDAINPIRQLGQDIKSDLQKASDVSIKPEKSEAASVAGLASDPVADPVPADTPVEPVAVPQAAVVSEPVADAGLSKVTGDSPPPARRPVRRKTAEPRVDPDAKVEDKPVATAKKAAPKAKPDPAPKTRPAPKKKTAKAGDA